MGKIDMDIEAETEEYTNKWKYFRKCSQCNNPVSPRKRPLDCMEYICTTCSFNERKTPVEMNSPGINGNLKTFRICCGPEIRKVYVDARDLELAVIEAIKKTKAKSLGILVSIKEKGVPTKWATTESILKEYGMWSENNGH